jgi:uncharacterized protein
MRLDLGQIRTPHERFEQVYRPEAFAAPGDNDDTLKVASPVTLAFEISKDQRTFRLVGKTQTTLEVPCSRCLEPMTVAVDAPFDLRYQPHSTNTGEGEKEIEEDDLTTAFYQHDEIDLEQLMREQFYLALPMKPLCSDGCKGLCPSCGTNLNRGACACKVAWEDPRLAVLKKLEVRSKKSELK